MNTIPAGLKEALQRSKRVLTACHINPDGDAVGAVAAIASIALHCGADVRILLFSPLPAFLSWLPLPAPVTDSVASLGDWTPDTVCIVDCGDSDRAGPELAAWLRDRTSLADKGWKDITVINIDHHVSNKGYGDINWVEPERAATGELVGLLAESMGIPLQGALGQALYLALASDTGNFTYSNTGADALTMAARIVAAGLDVGAFTSQYENNWSIGRMHLWGRLMSEISLHEDGAVAVCVVPKRYLDELGLRKADLEGFASWIRRLQGVRVSLFVREDADNYCKISLRSMGDVDVQTVASRFGGGGHAAAAGAEIALPPEEAAREVLAALRPAL